MTYMEKAVGQLIHTLDDGVKRVDKAADRLRRYKNGDESDLPISRATPEEESDDAEIYPCQTCEVMRSKNQGGAIFAVCDECWKTISWDPIRATPARERENASRI